MSLKNFISLSKNIRRWSMSWSLSVSLLDNFQQEIATPLTISLDRSYACTYFSIRAVITCRPTSECQLLISTSETNIKLQPHRILKFVPNMDLNCLIVIISCCTMSIRVECWFQRWHTLHWRGTNSHTSESGIKFLPLGKGHFA